MKDVGVIGLGNAGKPLALRLIDKGYRLRVYDLNPQVMDEVVTRGAAKAANATDAVSDITLTVLPSSVEVRTAAFGAAGVLAALKDGSTLIDLSGTDPGFTRVLSAEAEKRRAGFLGATLHAAGAPAVTIPNGLLSIVVGGKNETLESALPLLKDMAQKIICVPEPWIPKALKIAVIMFAASSAVAAAEVSSWLAAQGLDPRVFHELLKTTGSRASSGRMEDFLKRNNSHGGALSNSYKDIRQALATAAELGMPLPLMTAVSQMQEMGRALGLTRVNTPAAMGRLYEIITGQDLSAAVIDADKAPPQPRAPEVIYLK
ncbi:MAG TPA: NAD(P)-dependent oxidoreductase [Candidatus Binatia bacterium]|jgi:3-hydroxyisobutyrate dehydrogenase-like beta-hydroxyacid dehydrogenase